MARAESDAVTEGAPAIGEQKAPQPPASPPTQAAPARPADEPAPPKEAEAKPRDLSAPPKETADNGPVLIRTSKVNAVYRISWLGTNVGSFTLKSSISNRQYSLQANADVSVFFGSFTWQGSTSSNGLMTANGPVPQNYTFRYSTGEKREAVEMRFTQRMVRDIVINPPARPSSGHVPITAAHLMNVVDPLSAVVILSQTRMVRGPENACNKRMPIFDGRVRYDLILSPKGTRQIGNTGRLKGTAYVCSVRYVQIAGHKTGKRAEGDYVSGNTGIEIWLVPVVEAGLMVPYFVSVPTPAGTASMTSVKFDVETPAGRQASTAERG